MTEALRDIRAGAFNANLLPGIAIIYVKGALLAALTLFISTFATTNIFTVIVTVFVYFIGHLQAIAREFWLQEQGGGWLSRTFLALVALIFPDLQQFNLADEIVAGAAIPLALFLKTVALGGFYFSFICFSPRLSSQRKSYEASLLAVCALLLLGAARLPVEHALFLERTQQHLYSARRSI